MDGIVDTYTMRVLQSLLSNGYDEGRAVQTAVCQCMIARETFNLIQMKGKNPKEDALVGISGTDNDGRLLPHEEVLLPAWKGLADALSSVVNRPRRGFIGLIFDRVQLDQVSGLLLRAFKTAPLKMLTLSKNDLDRNGFEFAVNALRTSPTLESLTIAENSIESEAVATSLVHAAKEHRTLSRLALKDCNIGRSDAVLSALVPAFDHLTTVCLRGNGIGPRGANIIADCLVGTSDLAHLDLRDNLLDDDSAFMFADLLKTNTTLQILAFAGNDITRAGYYVLFNSVFDASSMNGVNDSNHTCALDFGPEDRTDFNFSYDARVNRNFKILMALRRVNIGLVKQIDDVPLEVMPRVLAFLQAEGQPVNANYKAWNETFLLAREWSMPLLYTSRLGPEPRRSERIRKNRVRSYMRK